MLATLLTVTQFYQVPNDTFVEIDPVKDLGFTIKKVSQTTFSKVRRSFLLHRYFCQMACKLVEGSWYHESNNCKF